MTNITRGYKLEAREINQEAREVDERMIGTKQAAKYLGVSQSLLYKMLRNGTGPAHYRLGSKYGFAPAHLDEFLAGCLVEPKEANG